MPRRATLSNSFSKGVLDPSLSERIDLPHYYNGLESALNIEIKPQGGIRRRAGSTSSGRRLRRSIVPLHITVDMIGAPNGGVPASIVDQNAATRLITDDVDAAEFVVCNVDLGASVETTFVDVVGFACSNGRFVRAVAVEYLDGAEWRPFAPQDAVARKTISSGISTLTIEDQDVSTKAEDKAKAYFHAPFTGRIIKLKTTLDDPLAGGDATVSISINGVDVVGGGVTIARVGSAAGDVDEAVPTGQNEVTVSDEIVAQIGGASTAEGTVDIALTIEKSQSVRTRRFGLEPGQAVSARHWRVVIYDAVGAGAVSVAGVRFWKEMRELPRTRGLSFARTTDLVYEMTVGDRNIDVWRDHVYVASVPTAVDERQVRLSKFMQSQDTLVIYHADVVTQQITRQGANDEWNGEPMLFENVPELTPGTAFGGDQDEVQQIDVSSLHDGDEFVIWLEDRVTDPITFNSSTVAGDVRDALVALGVPSGLLVEVGGGYAPHLLLSFFGSAGARRWPVALLTGTSRDGVRPETTVVQRGVDVGAPIFGDRTGWPRSGVIYQDRQILAGFRAAPSTYGVSRYGNPFDFTDEADPFTADLAFFGNINTDAVETINDVVVGRNIILLTSASEWYLETRTLDATQPPNVLMATRYGAKPGCPVVFAEGANLFIQKGGRVLRDMIYSDVELSFTAEALSLLGSHLLTDVVDMAHRPARSTDEGNHIFMVNDDGTLAFMPFMRGQEVVATAPWKTDGAYRGVFSDVLARVWTIVERQSLDHGADLYLEKFDGTHTLDAGVRYKGIVATDTISGLDVHEGKQVFAWADGHLEGPLLVTGGQVTLPQTARDVLVGLFPPLRARLPRIREKLQNGYPFRPPARVYEVELALAGTGQIDLAVNGGPFRDVPLTEEAGMRGLDIADEPPRDTTGLASPGTPADAMERVIRAITMIPGSGEFVYATDVVYQEIELFGETVRREQNMHNTGGEPDFKVSLGQLRQALPNARNVSLFVTWFGSDLRAGSCTLKPKVDSPGGAARLPYDWSVSGVVRGTADEVSYVDGLPAFGGTPADRSVRDAIAEMTRLGLAVTFTPFIIMDVPAGNALVNPYGGVSQPAYPWRGRITCSPAPGQAGSPDMTAVAGAQVAAFVGAAAATDFAMVADSVVYFGPNEWSYRRMILHYAWLCKLAGGVDTFVIGSEMRGLTWVRDALGSYPYVTALAQLAGDVKQILGAGTKVVYASDWSEFVPHQTGGAGEAFFHLDQLWSSQHIDAIGIDNYWPLSDWRSGSAHADYVAGWRSIYDRSYLQSNIAGGEGYDWYYASQEDRDHQVRTPITDADYGKPWIWRYKDLVGWWSNQHFNRPAGVEDVLATPWVPRSKPIWFMEVGCPAVDKGTNQPNVFYDPKSSESFFPYYSAGVQDERIQRAYIEALIGYYTPGQTGFSDAGNPASTVYGGRMVDNRRIYVYTWDGRFYPGFPQLSDVWSDGDLWTYGHWITGRVFLSSEKNVDTVPVGRSAELPMRDRLVTASVRITNLRGWSRHPTIEFSQSVPAPLELRALRYEVAYG